MSGYNDRRSQKRQTHYKPNSSPYKTNKSFSEMMNEDLRKFVYGNFHYYYGYRNQGTEDNRLMCMKREWLTGKDVLDIGCNAGHFTLAIARDFSPRVIIGIDIDAYLVRVARKNAIYYLNGNEEQDFFFPIAFTSKYGPFAAAVLPQKTGIEEKFPYNVSFIQANYVLDNDELVKEQMPEFDTVLCLSLTKWIHLNWGDEGLKRTFHRIFTHLRPGGFLILEAQPFSSYKKKKNMSDVTKHNFNNIKLRPEQFNEYLLKEVGFETCELIDVPAHESKGFSRPIYLFTKGGLQQRSSVPTHIKFDYSSSETSELSDCDELSD